MKSKISIVLAGLFALSITACSSESKKSEETQVPEMSTTMPAEIQTTTPEPEPEPVKVKKVQKKKADKKKKAKAADAEVH